MSVTLQTQADCDIHLGMCPHCVAAADTSTRLMWRNIESKHYLCCDHHGVFWLVGENDYPAWRYEPAELHAQNKTKIGSMQRVEPAHSRASAGLSRPPPR